MSPKCWDRARRALNRARQAIRFWWQRRTRGWDDSDTWGLDTTLAQLILPRLRRFRYFADRVTPVLHSEEEYTHEQWMADLDTMIEAFEFAASDRRFEEDISEEEWKRVQKGLDLFAELYFCLWW